MSVAFPFCICLSLQVTNETLISLFVIQVELQNNSCGSLTKKSCRDVIYLFVEAFLSYIHKGVFRQECVIWMQHTKPTYAIF